ncbi:MAG: response regulator, partial [Myxococcales bacterium]|nr:response regulator [Myxococcales bacterium]
MTSNPLLIVDDHVELAENLAEILEDLGHPCRIVESADQALDALSSQTFSGIITDYRLPESSGLELITELRKRGVSTPVVLISAFAADDVVRKAHEIGALDVLAKPVDFDQLERLVRAFEKNERDILIVDDDRRFAENIQEILHDAGFEVSTSECAREALARRDLPRLAVLDLMLPDGTGIDIAKRLFARDPT